MKMLYFKKSGAIFLIFFAIGIVQLHAEEASKRVAKSFNISGDTRIDIGNKYGDVIIKRWDKNVLDLKVNIEANGKNETKTQKILDAIEITISDRISSGSLSIQTEIGNINGDGSFSINYEISMPNTNPMSLRNSFGNVYMGSYQGELDLEVKYGQLMAEDLDQASVRIEFSNSRCEIETLSSGELDVRYSKLTIDEAGDIRISSQFSDLEIENAGHLEVEGKYGSFEIENLRSLTGDIQFAGLDIEWLEESLHLETRHGDGINLDKVSSRFKDIDIASQFSSVAISVEKGVAARLEFDLQFGNLRAVGEGINFNKVVKDHTTSEYEGYLVNANATSSIKVAAKYANIRFDVD